MELEVRVVRGMEGCFVSLPLHVIQLLDSTSGGNLPPLVALELRSLRTPTPQLWHVSWSGSSSSSSDAIEISQQFAECISLPDHMAVQVRAIPNLAKATLVTIEPHTEDDWEVLELNAEHAETTILKQVGIVHEGMRFPLWLHGQTVITFIVVSTFPNKPMVQLVPKTQVAVAPKRRKRPSESYKDSLENEDFSIQALLRIQDADSRFFHKCEVNGVEMDVVLTTAVFVHPETAKVSSLDCLQPVVLEPRLAWKEMEKDHATANARGSSNLTSKEVNNGIRSEKKEVRQAVVRLLLSDSVAKGHVMLSQSLRRYLRSSLHSWIYVRKCNVNQKNDPPSFSISPCDFKFGKKEATEYTGAGDLDNHNILKTKSIHLQTNSEPDVDMDLIDWSTHDRFIAAFSNDSPGNQGEEGSKSTRKGVSSLLRAWFLAQLDVIGSNTGVDVNSLVLGNRILLHFESKVYKYVKREKEQTAYDGSVGIRTRAGESSTDIIYVLSNSEKYLGSGAVNAYEYTLDEGTDEDTKSINLNLLLEKLQLGEGVSFYSVKERLTNKCFNTTISSLSWMGTTASDVTNRLTVLLSSSSGMFFGTYHLPFPGHVLIYGPPGSGKTLLATTVAKSVEEHKDVLAHVVLVSCSRLALEKSQNIRQALSGYISEALDHAPSVIVLDDLDSIIASSSDTEGYQSSSSSASLAQYLTDIIDEYEEKRRSSCGIGPLAFIACAQTLTNIPQTLSSSGRFDFHVQLPAPAAAERGALLKHELQKRSLHCSDEILFDVASSCDGYDAYDLEILVDRSVHAATGRFVSSGMASEERKKPTLYRDDFSQAMKGFLPVAMRDVTKSASEGGCGGWEDVGGLIDIRNSIKEMIELPSKFPKIFSQAPLRMRSNVLLYGPPGCGKTHIVGAAAAACSLRFISVKGPELLNKYIGASEQAVRDIFSKAAAAAPCLLFFDEFDSIAPKRGHDNTGVTDRVVNQFLTELDGVEVLTGVFVFAATSRPDLLDAALLRPGRLDRLLFCDFPSQHERLDILTVLSRKLPMAKEVDLDMVSHMTEGFSGADLQALLSDAQLAAVHDLLDSKDGTTTGKMPVITDTLLKSVTSSARPSVSEAEKRRLYSIYSQFLEAKRSAATQSRDAKGKRATLA